MAETSPLQGCRSGAPETSMNDRQETDCSFVHGVYCA